MDIGGLRMNIKAVMIFGTKVQTFFNVWGKIIRKNFDVKEKIALFLTAAGILPALFIF